jgi:hypothetical protein
MPQLSNANPMELARLSDGGPRYTETPADPAAPAAPLIAEPWNAVTASMFIAIAVAWIVRLRGRWRQFPFLICCLPILLAGGVGGTLYHGLRNERFFFLLDVVPIQLLAIAGSVYMAIRLWGRRGWLYLGGSLIIYMGVNRLLFSVDFSANPQLRINLHYATLAAIIVLPIALQLIVTRFRHAQWIAAALVAFAIAWFFRLWDQYAGPYMHSFGAAATALVIEYFYKTEAEKPDQVG